MTLLFTLFLSLICLVAASDYHERLELQPLPAGSLLASFNFRSNASQQSFDQQHFRYFPRSLGQILQHAHTKELHLRFTTGRWDAESWGTRPWNGTREGGTGVELWAWIDAANAEDAFAHWITLTQSLSGLFCASLNFIDSTRTTRPVATFEPEGDHHASDADGSLPLHLLHGTLPGEVVCTENLTPFLKLLPCKGKAGISSLFDGHKLFDASWQSMSVDIRPLCPDDGSECVVQIEQAVDMVLDIDRSKRPRDNPIPRPVPDDQLLCDTSKPYHSHDTCYPLDKTTDKSWSLTEVFGRSLNGVCSPAHDADSSDEEEEGSVCLHVPHERDVFISPGAVEKKNLEETSRCFTLQPSGTFDLVLSEQDENHHRHSALETPVLSAERTMIGHGQERGGMRIIFDNPSATDSVDFIYFEALPWFLRPYLHTLQATVTGHNDRIPRSIPTAQIIKESFYRPAIDRQRGTQLELALSVPPASRVTLTYDFEKAILRYTEYPPDANRGFNVAPAVIKLAASNNHAYLRTTSLLLPLPTPDFSMPYNVIILTSTVIALAFGSIFNLLTRRFVAAEQAEALGSQTLKGRIGKGLLSLRDRVKRKTKTE
ncbi:hypothetical protein ASPZODRAFT_69576 [Penicilliopsis zonata CBS 506.65]|uniref:GPI transamidase component Gpi16 n=1 Tax=Penicilliopsis zonata CBS 506.65 TaxID=1073090 RepID=A0A1L9SDU2_9EURO|nr:hypothetical protein ASPZODRAFT_69576 [Penicilliopsis zonata CBS 506.65]OJJ45312.1 hypothetical protein ASPZODRAFT_69576 [Penicilliopsis zonata CBS 506.65]